MNSVSTVNEVFYLAVERSLPRVMSYERDGTWHDISSAELYSRAYRTAIQLRNWGIRKGDRVAIVGENRFEWAIADWACLLLGVVDVPIYPTLTGEQAAFILQNSGATIAFVSTRKQFDKILGIQSQTSIQRIVTMDEVDHPAAARMSDIMGAGATVPRDAEFDRAAQAVVADDLATIIYTSGTTGVPKGVMLTHGNLASNLSETARTLNWTPGHVSLSFLPLSHVTARHVDYLCMLRGITLAYCPSFDELAAKLQQVRPHLFVGVPRVYEKVKQEVERRAASGVKKKVFDWAMAVGRQHREEIVRGETPSAMDWKLAHKLVFSSIHAWFGGRAETFVSGGAPLGVDLARWYADVGVRILEGYGLTETSPVIAVNEANANKLGTVGKPLANVECRIADDGELLVRGPSIFKGYWNNPEETASAFVDGWFKTGDIANIDSEGYLSITDRKKDLIKTSGGKFVAPQPIENRLKMSPLVGYPVLVGNGRKFISAVIAPNFPALELWARERSLGFDSRAQLVRIPEVMRAYEDIVSDVNRDLAQFETIKKVLVIADEFSIDAGEVTPTLKLRRRAIENKYREQIDGLYAEDRSAPRSTLVSS